MEKIKMNSSLTLSINSIIRPTLPVTDFIKLAKKIGFTAVELRNDLPDPRVYGNETAEEIITAAGNEGIEIITVNALQRFNDREVFEEKQAELEQMAKTSADINCRMVVLCPVNDPKDNRSKNEQVTDLADSLKLYAPILKKYGITGLIEPLGFPICSVRTKAQAVKAIKETNLADVYKITHDTFHHYLSGETEFFPAETGLVHASGVLPGKAKEDITDDDRILVTAEDCMGNVEQLKELFSGGYQGPVSYEAFSPAVQTMSIDDLTQGINESVKVLLR